MGTLSVTQPADEKKGNKETNKDLTFPFTTCGKCCNIKVSMIEKGKEPKTQLTCLKEDVVHVVKCDVD